MSQSKPLKETCKLVKRVVFCWPQDIAGEFPFVSNRIKLTAQIECKIIIMITVMTVVIIIMMIITTIIISHVYEAANKSSFSFQPKYVIFS